MRLFRFVLAMTVATAAFGAALSGCGRVPASFKKPAQEDPVDEPDLDPDPFPDPGIGSPSQPGQPSWGQPTAPVAGAPEPWPSPLPDRQWPPLVWKPLPNYTPIPSSNIPTPAPGGSNPTVPAPGGPGSGGPGSGGPGGSNPPAPAPVPTPTPVPPPPVGDPPAGWQPSTSEEFYQTLRKFGYNGTREQAFARVRQWIGIERDVWSPSSAKQLDAKWRKARTYMDPAPIRLEYYDAQAKAFARHPNAYYVRTDYSFREGSDLMVIKADPMTRESLAYNLKGEMTYFTQLRAMQGVQGIFYRHAIRVPPEIYRGR